MSRRPRTYLISTTTWLLTGHGSSFQGSAGAGNLARAPSPLAGVLIAITVIGFTPIAAGTGARLTPGAGLHSIMVAGTCTRTRAGSGALIEFGVLHGSPGAQPETPVAGLRYRRMPFTIFAPAGIITVFGSA